MAKKSNLRKFQVIKNASGVGNLTSSVTSIEFLDNIGYQVNITGTLTGTFNAQVSIDYMQDEFGNIQNPGNWVSIPVSPAANVTAGNPTSIYMDINQISAPYIRLIYTAGGGSGTVNAFLTAKVL